MEMLTATIQKSDVRIRELDSRARELEVDVGRWGQDQKAATEVRQGEKQDFRVTVQDYQDSIDAITNAIAVLKRQAFDRSQAGLVQSELLQVRGLQLVPA